MAEKQLYSVSFAFEVGCSEDTSHSSFCFPITFNFMDEEECILFWTAVQMWLAKVVDFKLITSGANEASLEASVSRMGEDEHCMRFGPVHFHHLTESELSNLWTSIQEFTTTLMKLAREHGFAFDRETVPSDGEK